jgi:hypothetical protein
VARYDKHFCSLPPLSQIYDLEDYILLYFVLKIMCPILEVEKSIQFINIFIGRHFSRAHTSYTKDNADQFPNNFHTIRTHAILQE